MVNYRKAMDKLFVSRVRIKLLKYFLENPDVPIHLRGAVRELKEEINAVRRELIRLEETQILKCEVRGNRKYYFLSQQAPFMEELRGIVYKSFGLGGEIIRNRNKLGEIKFAIITSNYYSGVSTMQHPVDLVIVGDLDMDLLNQIIDDHERAESREINYTVFSTGDFELRRKRRDAFVTELMLSPKIMLVGTQEELLL